MRNIFLSLPLLLTLSGCIGENYNFKDDIESTKGGVHSIIRDGQDIGEGNDTKDETLEEFSHIFISGVVQML